MDRERIFKLIEELDQLVPTKDAEVLLVQYGGGADESKVVASEIGYLRFGLEMMKGAYLPMANENRSNLVQMNLESFISENSTVSFDCFERVENIEQLGKAKPSPKLIGWVIAGIGGLVVCMLVIGVTTTVRWFIQ